MNLKTLLVTGLLFVILMGLMSFGYLTYAVYNNSTSQSGDKHIASHQLWFYVQVVMHVLAFGLGTGIYFKT